MQPVQIAAPELGVLANMLRRVEFFSPLTVGQLDKVLPAVMLHSYDKGERVFTQGETGDAFYIVYRGSVDVRLRKLLVMSKTVTTLGPGEFFGEIALISDAPRNATVVCREPTLLFTLISDDFQFVLRENPAAAEEMRRIAARRRFATSRAG